MAEEAKMAEHGWEIELWDNTHNKILKYYGDDHMKLHKGDSFELEIKHAEMETNPQVPQVLNGEPQIEKTKISDRKYTITAVEPGEGLVSIFIPHCENPINGIIYPDSIDLFRFIVEE